MEPARHKSHASLKKDDSSEEDDEEIDEDEAFNSDDERKYGAFFQKDYSVSNEGVDSDASDEKDDDDGSDDGDNDDEEEGDGGQYMLDLLNRLESTDSKPKSVGEVMARHVPESQFAASVVPTAELTLDALLQGLESTKGFFGKEGLQSAMKDMITSTNGVKTTSAPLPKITTDRMQRKLQYEQEQKNLSMWIDAVQEHRTAETLDFTPKERLANLTREKMIDKFEPTTDFEKELFAAIQQQQQESEKDMVENPDDDDLGAHNLSLEEYKQRRAQLAKMRALLFYHEVKRHHINKIKSKTYRRIRKKQRQRQKEGEVEQDPDLANELKEKEELERLKERMTLAHKNTSKWAKRVLKRGKSVDVNTRRALSAQLQRGDDLRKKMSGIRGQGEDEDDTDDDPNSLLESARQVLADTEGEDQEPQGIFKLSFMQRGIEKQREQARDEARQLLLELQANAANDEGADYEDGDNMGESSDTHVDQLKKSKKKEASDKEMKNVIAEGELVASALAFGKSSSKIEVTDNIEIDLGGLRNDMVVPTSEDRRAVVISVGKDLTRSDNGSSPPSKKHEVSRPQSLLEKASEDVDSNPWVSAAFGVGKSQRAFKTGFVDVESAVDLLFAESDKKMDVKKSSAFDHELDASINQVATVADKKIVSLTQEELVRRAFCTDSHEEVDEEFAKEKQTVTERDDPISRQRKTDTAPKIAAGWGSWAGAGDPETKLARKPQAKNLKTPEPKPVAKRKRQDDKKSNVIINEKRIKKTANDFQIANIPYPYTSREEYERAMTGGIGREWNVTSGFKNLTRPEILTRSGKIIQPISKRAKKVRPAAKF